MNTLVIEKSALINNLNIIKEQAGACYIYAALPGDGFGAGAVLLAKLLRDEGIRRFCVDSAEAADAMRRSGLVDEEILMLHSTCDSEVLAQLADLNVICSVGSLEAGMALNALAEARAGVVEAHLQVDCGMGFGGFAAEEPEKILSMMRNLPKVAFSGMYTRFSDGKRLDDQLALFQQVAAAIHDAGRETGIVHAAGPQAIVENERVQLDAIQVDTAILGRGRRKRKDGLQPVGFGESTIDSVQWLPKGHSVGSGKRIVLRKPTRVAVLPVGYQHGFGVVRPAAGLWESIRSFRRTRRRFVRVNGQKAKVLGGVGAGEVLVNVSGIKCSEGDKVVFPLDPVFAKNCVREYR